MPSLATHRVSRAWLDRHALHPSGERQGRGRGLPRAPARGLARGFGPEPEAVPPYIADWSEPQREERLWAAALRHLLAPKPLGEAAPGDVLLFRMREGGVAKHLGIHGADRPRPSFVHAYSGHGVIESPLTAPWARRIVARFAFPEGGTDGDDPSFRGRRGDRRLHRRYGLGPVRGRVGRAVGATMGRRIDQRLLGQGSRAGGDRPVDRFRLTGASEGAPVAQVFGRMRVGGQVIWASRFLEHTSRANGGGKGAPQRARTGIQLHRQPCARALRGRDRAGGPGLGGWRRRSRPRPEHAGLSRARGPAARSDDRGGGGPRERRPPIAAPPMW